VKLKKQQPHVIMGRKSGFGHKGASFTTIYKNPKEVFPSVT
jgi:hypothetical protein